MCPRQDWTRVRGGGFCKFSHDLSMTLFCKFTLDLMTLASDLIAFFAWQFLGSL